MKQILQWILTKIRIWFQNVQSDDECDDEFYDADGYDESPADFF